MLFLTSGKARILSGRAGGSAITSPRSSGVINCQRSQWPGYLRDHRTPLISVKGSGTEVRGGNISIFGGSTWTLDLRSLESGAIVASRDITLSVGSAGTLDLRENNTKIFQVGGLVRVYADNVHLDPGVTLNDLVDGKVQRYPSRTLGDVSATGPGQATVLRGTTQAFNLSLFNNGPIKETYNLSWTDTAGWNLGALPAIITISGLDSLDLTLNLTPPASANLGQINVITVTARSVADPNRVAVIRFEVRVETRSSYLPVIIKNETP